MKRNEPLTWLACLALLGSVWSNSAEESAVVKDGRVNVRGQPSLVGEVITQLQKGEKVVVLEVITLSKPKTNEPPKWARIQMPPNTPVWVFASFIDPTAKAVKVPKLNLRAGPGENFSVVGRLEKGATVNEIRRVEDWMEIETPPGAYGFVAANLLTKPELMPVSPAPKPDATQPAAPVPSLPPETAKTEPPADTTPAPAPTTPPESSSAVIRPPDTVPSPPQEQKPELSVTDKTSESTKAVEPAKPPPFMTESPKPSTPTVIPPPPEAPHVRRVVRREGIVRSTVSIQSPTYYELLSPENRKTINYLHTDKLDVNLKDYRGRRIVVTGEESIDPRWTSTPVIELETLELIP